jgi:hypothetical protein
MRHLDGDLGFMAGLVAWAILVSLLLGACGGGQRPCAVSNDGPAQGSPCRREQR